MAILTKKQVAKELTRYNDYLRVTTDNHNRDNDDDLTVAEAQKNPSIVNLGSFNDWLEDRYPQIKKRRLRKEAQQRAREEYMQLPLSERIRFQALSEMAGALRVHADNLKEIEAELEAEMEDEAGMGLF